MNPTQRILVVIGTRPEAVKMAPVVHALQAAPWAEVRVLATAQHRQLLDPILKFFGVTPDRDLDVMRPDQSLADLTARLLSALDPVLVDERPDVVLAQGDTTTVLATALACFYRKVCFGHVEAGLRTGDKTQPFPEEANRELVGRLAALHFAPTAVSRDNLLREGIPPAQIHVIGNTVVDALQWASARVDPGRWLPADGRRLVLVTAHRREHFGARFEAMCQGLRRVADRGDVELLYPVHPNPNVRGVVHRVLGDHPRVRLVDPLDYPDMVAAMRAATLLLSDSGGVQEEAPTLGKPVLVLRSTTERPEGVAAGAARLVGTDPDRIVAEAARLLDDPAAYAAMATVRNPYGDGTSSRQLAAVLQARGASSPAP
ncbi:MAG: non-hydrolyzing UDP-N-acetylglucosamine 2-epimerase [Planctomycetota bacterium]